MSIIIQRTFSTTCNGALLENINADPAIGPLCEQIVNDGGATTSFYFDVALDSGEVAALDAKLASWVCPIVYDTLIDEVIDDTIGPDPDVIWSSDKITDLINPHFTDTTIHFTKSSILLDDLGDVVITTPIAGQALKFNGTNWINTTDLTGTGTVTSVSATGSTGLSVSGSPITSSGTLTLTLDTGLQNLASFATTGILVATATDTWAARQISVGSTKLTISNATGVSGNPTLDLGTVALDHLSDVIVTTPTSGQIVRFDGTNWVNGPDYVGTVTSVALSGSQGITVGGSPITSSGTMTLTLDAGLANLASFNVTGLVVATGADTWDSRSIVVGSTKLSISHGSGVTGNPTIDLGTVTLDHLSDVVITSATNGQVLKFNGTNWINAADASDMAVVQVSKNTTTSVTTAYADIVWTTQEAETNTTIIEWVSGANVTVKEAGMYLISYTFHDNNTGSDHTVNTRVRKNATTVLPSSSAMVEGKSGNQDIISQAFVADLAANDTLQLQASASATFSYAANIRMSVIRLKAGGSGGGSSIIVQDEGTSLSGGPFTTLNFVGASVTATPPGGGVAQISVSGGTPAAPTTSIQYNNAGAFGGTANNVWDNTNNRQTVSGAVAQNRLTLYDGTGTIDATQQATAALYIQVDGDSTYEGLRTYFKRASAGISGWIAYHYDQSTPNIRITDEDDDPPYISFATIGTGTYDNPLYVSMFGARGGIAGRTGGANSGFSWHIGANTNPVTLMTNNLPVMELDSQFLRIPSGTTAQRPATGINGMIRNNTTTNKLEGYENGAWADLVQTTAGITVQDEGTPVAGGPFTTLNFVGASIAATPPGGGVAQITVTSSSGGGVFGEGFQQASSDALATTTSTTPVQKVTLTTAALTTGAVYRIGYTAEIANSTTANRTRVQVQINNTTTIADSGVEPQDATNWYSINGFYYFTGAGAAITIDMDYYVSGGSTASIQRARLEIWRVS